MAVIKTGSTVADIRGKVGDNVYTRGQGGATIRSVGTWTQPNTVSQVEVRVILATLSDAWSSSLTEDQRENWRSYAGQHPRPDRWGGLNQTSGYLAFIRHNFHAYREAEALVFPNAPTAAPLHVPTLAIEIDRATLIATITLPPSNYSAGLTDLALYIASGIPLAAGRSYYSGPWRPLATIMPPDAAGPAPLVLPWTWPVHATEPQYAWPIDGTGQTRAYAIAQDMTTGAISTKRIVTPTMVTA